MAQGSTATPLAADEAVPSSSGRLKRVWNHLVRHQDGYTLSLTAFAALASMVGAIAAWRAANIASAQVTYAAKIQAISSFARAAETYSSAVRVATFDMADETFNYYYASSMSDNQMMSAAQVARKVIDARSPYIAELDAQAAIWSDPTVKLIAASQAESLVASQCFLQLGAQANKPTPLGLKTARDHMLKLCPNANSIENLSRIEATMKIALTAMSKELSDSAR